MYRVPLLGLMATIILCAMAHNSSHAAEASGDVKVVLLAAVSIDITIAHKLCRQGSEEVECDIREETIQNKYVPRRGPKRSEHRSPVTYNRHKMFSAHFE